MKNAKGALKQSVLDWYIQIRTKLSPQAIQEIANQPKVTKTLFWSTLKPMVACFFCKTVHVATVAREQRRKKFKNKPEMIDYCALWQCEMSHIRSNQRLGSTILSPEDAIEAFKNHVLKAVSMGVKKCVTNTLYQRCPP